MYFKCRSFILKQRNIIVYKCCINYSLYFYRISEGNKFSELERSLADTAAQQIDDSISFFNRLNNKSLTFEDIENEIGSLWPSDNFLKDTFLNHFRNHKQLYRHKLQEICGSTMAMDHTFKVSSNIGFVRSDGAWVALYETLFIAVNETGQVMDYKLTKSTAFQEVQDILLQLKERLLQNDTTELLAVIDNCCQWAKKIQHTLSPIDVSVKLDIFHAIARITSTLAMGSACRKEIVNEFKFVVRAEGDTQQKRNESTPNNSIISENIKQFLRRWKNKSDINGKILLSAETHDAIIRLMKHVEKGCLSHIPPGCGTNKNERLHKLLNNSSLSVAKIGPELAEAILAVTFYRWNTNKVNEGEYRPIPRITEYAAIKGNLHHYSPPQQQLQECVPELPLSRPTLEPAQLGLGNTLLHKCASIANIYKHLHAFSNINPDLFALANIHRQSTLAEVIFNCKLPVLRALQNYGYNALSSGSLEKIFQEYSGQKIEGIDYSNTHLALQQLANKLNQSIVVISGEKTAIPAVVYVSQSTDSEPNTIVLGCEAINSEAVFYLSEKKAGEPQQEQSASANVIHSKRDYCRCGINNHDLEPKCVKKRCICWVSKRPCGSECQCKHCNNEYGQRVTRYQVKRRKKMESEREMCHITSATYLSQNGLRIPGGKWRFEETVLLVCVRLHLSRQNRNNREASSTTISQLFKEIQEHNKSENIVEMRCKNKKEITGKLTHLKKRFADVDVVLLPSCNE